MKLIRDNIDKIINSDLNIIKRHKSEQVPIFFAIDDRYIPFLAVTLQSLIEHTSKNVKYLINILYTDISEENKEKIKKYEKSNVSIEFIDLSEYMQEIQEKLYIRDYYSKTTYFRLFIPELFPQLDKAIYLDSDIVVLKDIALLYDVDLKDNLLGAIPDDSVQIIKSFQDYVEKVIGVSSYKKYFNAGVLSMNLKALREINFIDKFVYLLDSVKYKVAQDQDYLNRLCKGRVKLLDNTWNRMPIGGDTIPRENLKIIHYNLSYKPWHFEKILYKEYFWEYAKQTEFFDDIMAIKNSYKLEDKFFDMETEKSLKELTLKESECVGDDRVSETRKYIKKTVEKKTSIPKAKDRLEVLKKIEQLEEEGKFDVDPEDDPPTITLKPENVDYLKQKNTSKIKTKIANKVGEKFLDSILKNNKLIIREVNGIENLNGLNSGAIITCNHFNPFDVFAIEDIYRMSNFAGKKTLYKVIREGNYTNFPGLYGFLFRNSDTLPLSSNTETMKEFLKSIKVILNRGDFILIYPEQSLWWNYKKPKPLKSGAFKFAVENKVPVLPIFITMQDTEAIGKDGFPVQEYIINIGEPIYPIEGMSIHENVELMKNENFNIWKKCYEKFYRIPLEYTTKIKEEVMEDGE